MRTADRATGGLGKSVAGIGKAAREAHTAIGATAKELRGLRGGVSHAATAAREMRTLVQSSRRAVRATTKDFSQKITVQGEATSRASRERSSFSD